MLGLPPARFPVTVTLERVVAANALVSAWGNRYSVPPGLVGASVTVRHRHGTDAIDNTIVVTHRLALTGAHRTIRLPEHTAALENVVPGPFSTERPCPAKINRPPSPLALALAAELGSDQTSDPVIDLDIYRRLLEGDAS